MEDGSNMTSDKVRDIEEWEADDKRKQRSSKSRQSVNEEGAEGLYGSGRRSTGDRSESRKRSGGSSRANFDVDDSDSGKESRSKQMKKNQEDSTLEKLSSWYQDGEQENKYDGRESSTNRGPGQADEAEKKKLGSKFSDHDSSWSRIKGKDERNDRELEKSLNRDSRYSERKETNQEKVCGSSEQGRNQRRRWDDSDAVKKAEEGYHVEKSDTKRGTKHDSAGERSVSARVELSHSKSRALDSSNGRGMKSHDRETRRIDSESGKSKGGTEAAENNNKGSSLTHEERSGKERIEKHRQHRSSSSQDVDSHERPSNTDEDGARMREKSRREGGRSSRSKTPERSGRQYHETENLDTYYGRGTSKRKELEKDGYRDDKLKGRDDSWSDWKKNQEGYKDNWRRRHPSGNEKDAKDGDMDYDQSREWELQRHGHDMTDNESAIVVLEVEKMEAGLEQ